MHTNDWENIFTVQYNDSGRLYLIQKGDAFSHDEEGMQFKFRMAVEAINLRNLNMGNQIYISLILVPEPECWCSQIMESLKDMCGIDDMKPEDVLVSDALGVCAAVRLTEEYADCKEDDECCNILDCKEAVEYLNKAALSIPAVSNLRGFFLDKTWNQIGNNGWDIICMVINGTNTIEEAYKNLASAAA